MSLFMMKSMLATVFLAAGFVAVLSMLTLMGKAERSVSAATLRRLHKSLGTVFALLLVVISIICMKYVAVVGDQIPTRGVIHGALASLVMAVLLIKILIVQFYKEFMRFAPALGIVVFVLAFATLMTSAGHFFTVAGRQSRPPAAAQAEHLEEATADRGTATAGDPARGADLFGAQCGFCHHTDTRDAKIGPGLESLYDAEALPSSDRPVNDENVRDQLLSPVGTMPSFEGRLSEDDIADLLAYMKSL